VKTSGLFCLAQNTGQPHRDMAYHPFSPDYNPPLRLVPDDVEVVGTPSPRKLMCPYTTWLQLTYIGNQIVLIRPYHERAHAFAEHCLSSIPAEIAKHHNRAANDLLNKIRDTNDINPWGHSPYSGIQPIVQIKLEIVVYGWVSNRIIDNEGLAEERRLGPMWPSELTDGDKDFDDCIWRAPDEGLHALLI